MDEIVKKNPELYHYTPYKGLKAILNEQRFRLTYIRNLNDASEMIAFRSRLETYLTAVCLERIIKKSRYNKKTRNLADENGGPRVFAQKIASYLTDRLYEQLSGTKDLEPFAKPFILSFCTPGNDLIAQHGLLSQWRAYGQDGGYALVFDTEKLHQQLKEDAAVEPQRYSSIIGDVVYSHESDERVRAELSENIHNLESAVSNFLTDGNFKHLEETITPLITCSCLYKHWGFFEEREIRLVVVPFVGRLLEVNSKEFKIGTMPIVSIENAGQTKDYIYMLEDEEKPKPLPIKRIIVGPHANQREHEDNVNKLLRELELQHIEVTKSEIPYI